MFLENYILTGLNFPLSYSEPWRMGTSLSVKGSGKARISKVSKTFYILRPRKNCRKTYFVLVLTGTGRYMLSFFKKNFYLTNNDCRY